MQTDRPHAEHHLSRILTWLHGRRKNHRARQIASRHVNDGGLAQPVARAISSAMVASMARRLGLTLSDLPASAAHRDDLVHKCIKCKNRDTCRLWLDDPEAPIDGFRTFCPNADRLDALLKNSAGKTRH